jgi:hypothetical protein
MSTTNATSDEEAQIDDVELACMAGHQEAKQRLLPLPEWDARAVADLERYAHSYEDFARCVAEEVRRANSRRRE